jgi:hypothetical protein
MTATIFATATTIRDDITRTLQAGEGADTINIDGVVSEIVSTVGIEGYADMDMADFYAIVARHDSTQV